MVQLVNLPVWLSVTILVFVPAVLFYGFAAWVNKQQRRKDNWLTSDTAKDVGNFLFSIVGIMLGLILVNAWEDRKRAQLSVIEESQQLVAIGRMSRRMPSEHEEEIRDRLLEYINHVISQEFPAMYNGEAQPIASWPTAQINKALARVETRDPVSLEIYTNMWPSLNRVSDLRRERLYLANGTIPTIMWLMVFAGATIALAVISINCPVETKGHPALVAVYALSLSLVIYVVAVLQFPFSGSIHVGSQAFQDAHEIIHTRDTL